MLSSTDVITILGKRGHGKTTMCRTLQSAFPRVLILDRLREYNESKTPTFTTFEGLGSFLIENERKTEFRAVFQFDIESDAHDELFNEIMRVAYYTGNLLIVIEEVHNFANPNFLPKYLREIILTGRHQNIGLIMTSQRAAEVHKTCLSQSSQLFIGCHFERNDIQYLKSIVGEHAEKLPGVEPFKFLHYIPGVTAPEIVPNR